MDSLKLSKFKKILLALKEDALKASINVEILKIEKASDEVDTATSDNATTLATKFFARNNLYLKRIDQALKKVEEGTYGECENCSIQIAEKRLIVRPIALLCVDCKEEQEKEERKEKEKGGILVDWD